MRVENIGVFKACLLAAFIFPLTLESGCTDFEDLNFDN
ncbi:hypothetical protein MFFC18_09520 [Mariniblastus fucicola]|uniref:Uncharacterized protein n=1 Tax=Mariniblastus fucicola TaxID=980251 RepID=A0A5B9P8A4_9BACT|nr:hypothetical protein MFFC18_09520 [Mariniblastus fucicola]